MEFVIDMEALKKLTFDLKVIDLTISLMLKDGVDRIEVFTEMMNSKFEDYFKKYKIVQPYKGSYPKVNLNKMSFGCEDVFVEIKEKDCILDTFKLWNTKVEELQNSSQNTGKNTSCTPENPLGIYKIKRKFFYTCNADTCIPLPERGTAFSAGYDFFASEEIKVPARGYSPLVFFNVKCLMPYNEYLAIHIRSSFAIKHGLQVAQGTSIIDCDYFDNENNEGNIGIMFYNHSDKPFIIKKGERCCQGIFCKYNVTDDDNTTKTRTGGYGSTGKE